MEPCQTVDTSCQTELPNMERGRREEKPVENSCKEPEVVKRGEGDEEDISWLDYPFLTDRRSRQQLQSSQVGGVVINLAINSLKTFF